jgi:hypothetical protein
MKTASDFLRELWGDKELYTKYETLIAMIDYAQHVLTINRAEVSKIIHNATA